MEHKYSYARQPMESESLYIGLKLYTFLLKLPNIVVHRLTYLQNIGAWALIAPPQQHNLTFLCKLQYNVQ